MKNLVFLFVVCCFTVNVFAQSAAQPRSFTTPTQFDWSPDGSGVYMTVVKVDMDRGGAPQSNIFYANQSGEMNPIIKNGGAVSVSHDGKQLAFIRNAGTDRFASNELYLFDLETKTEKLLLADATRKSELNFSPDGKRLVYTVTVRDQANPQVATADIYVCDLASQKIEQLTRNEYGKQSHSPQWDAAGEKILYHQEAGDNHDQIYLTDAKGNRHVNVTADAATHNFHPVWYGKQIMYIQSPNKVMTMDADGKNRAEITGLINPLLAKAKGTKLAYLSRSADGSRIATLYMVDLKSNEAKALVSKDALAKLDL